MTVSELIALLKVRDPTDIIVVNTGTRYYYVTDEVFEARVKIKNDRYNVIVISIDQEVDMIYRQLGGNVKT